MDQSPSTDLETHVFASLIYGPTEEKQKSPATTTITTTTSWLPYNENNPLWWLHCLAKTNYLLSLVGRQTEILIG